MRDFERVLRAEPHRARDLKSELHEARKAAVSDAKDNSKRRGHYHFPRSRHRGSYRDTNRSGSNRGGTLRGFTGRRDREYYRLLGIDTRASPADIRKAYHKLALKFHPDKNTSPSAQGKFKSIVEAYHTLSDPQKRRSYDLGVNI